MTSTLLPIACLCACQSNISTPFPPGLEPLETNPVPQGTAPFDEMLQTQTSDSRYIHIYGRGHVLAPPAQVWQAAQAPDPNVAVCTTSSHSVTLNDEPDYAYSFLVHYEVDDVLTVKWDDQWRFGVIQGTASAPKRAIIRHQKIQGSDFITLSEGTIQLSATSDPDVTELAFVEHLDATGGSTGDVLKGVKHNFASLVAASHASPIPPCP